MGMRFFSSASSLVTLFLAPVLVMASVVLVTACKSEDPHPPLSTAPSTAAGGGGGGSSISDGSPPDTTTTPDEDADVGDASAADVNAGCLPTCTGCCDLNNVCQPGTANGACNNGSGFCVDCTAAGNTCLAGVGCQ